MPQDPSIALRLLKAVRQFRKLDNIQRFSLMRCSKSQSVSEHTMSVVMIVHAIAYEVLPTEKLRLKAITRAIFHDFAETFTGDISYDVKFMQEELQRALEKVAQCRLDLFLHDVNIPVLYDAFTVDALDPSEKLIAHIVKFADILELYLYTEEEVLSGNLHMVPLQQRAKDMIQNCKLIGISDTALLIANEIGPAEIPRCYDMINSYPGPLLAETLWEKIEGVFRSILHLRRRNGD